MMQKTLKDILRNCRTDLKKHLAKRDKWVRDWPGQVRTLLRDVHPQNRSRPESLALVLSLPKQMLITSSQIQWTADCEKALDRGDKKGLKSLKKKQVCVCTMLGYLNFKLLYNQSHARVQESVS